MARKTFASAVQNTPVMARTANGAVTFASSLDKNVDLFFTIGAMRNKPQDAVRLFQSAYGENPEIASRILLWARDARGGAGERNVFREIVKSMIPNPNFAPIASKLITVLPEYGRWDDMLIFMGTPFEDEMIVQVGMALSVGDGLCAKWMPRQGEVAAKMRKKLGLSPKSWRKTLVELSDTVEQKLCARQFGEINFSHVPSVAAKLYQKTFSRRDAERYAEYRANLVKVMNGEKIDGVKVNASVLYPHEIVRTLRGRSSGDVTVSTAQWEALPNFLGDDRIIPVCDVSDSMRTIVGGTTSAMDVSVGLGLYLADKQQGAFKDMVLTFSERSKIHVLSGNIVSKCSQLEHMEWGMSTNLQSAFEAILDVAVRNKVDQKEMPRYVLIISDMEFNRCVQGTNLDGMRVQYANAGYEMPKVVFWNVNGRIGNSPALENEKNVALVSGFSPSIVKSILAADVDGFTPQGVMMKTISQDRYSVLS